MNDSDTSIDDEAELLALEALLAEANDEKTSETIATKENADTAVPRLREDSTFAAAFEQCEPLPTSSSCVREEEVDSSDEEQMLNYLQRQYNEYGADINKRLKQERAAQHETKVTKEVCAALKKDKANDDTATTSSKSFSFHLKNPHKPNTRVSKISQSFSEPAATTKAAAKQPAPTPTIVTTTPTSAVYTDPVFGLRIINPLISSNLLVERMAERKPVPFAQIAYHIERGDLSKDWVIAGALISKTLRATKNNVPYSIWRLSDLRGEIKTVSVFMFSKAHKDLHKVGEGMCVAILNPTVFEKRKESSDVACLSIESAQKVMVLGQSKDLGKCKARKRDGAVCNAITNLNDCDFCIFHMKQEYGKMSKRTDLQSVSTGLQDLRNKVLGKSEVFYAGQSYTAVPAKKSAKMILQDHKILDSLSEYAISPFAGSINHTSKPKQGLSAISVPYAAKTGFVSKIASSVESNAKQRLKDLERLKLLQAESNGSSNSNSTATTSTATANNSVAAEKYKNLSFSFSPKVPTLSRDNFCIEVNIGERKAELAKQRAAQVLTKKPLSKSNPNATRGTVEGKRRAIDELHEKFNSQEFKKQRMEEVERAAAQKTRIERIIAATSSHMNLVEMRRQEEQDKYFDKLQKKEALEEKMLNTFKMPCKAVICQTCKYTAFSAADRCKQEKHALKVVDAEKRFFQCKDCGNRTVTVFKLPKTSCKNCSSSHWQRAAMIRERKVTTGAEALSIRGDEETFIGSLAGNANLNLMVPEE